MYARMYICVRVVWCLRVGWWYLDVGELAEDDELALPVELVLDGALVPLGCIQMFNYICKSTRQADRHFIHPFIHTHNEQRAWSKTLWSSACSWPCAARPRSTISPVADRFCPRLIGSA